MNQEKYLHTLLSPASDQVRQLEKYAQEHNIPIMEPLGMDFLLQLIRIHQPKKILEIGTAIGYSALRMLEAMPTGEIITIERDVNRLEEARKNIKSFNMEDSIQVIHGDALELKEEVAKRGPFDLLFIDAAKGKYEDFFNVYSPLITDQGMIVSDNVLFKGYVANSSQGSERFEKIASKIRRFNQSLNNHEKYHTTIVPIGDGVAITVKK
ncbi:O-methyltransferase [Halobacillus seohaensis]|uniref:tRNA 5-hydroxyuridine methyltransferase n=1 Tax=Halobacillus seohaensis TaxID=447421 RepID=A0ABW2EIB9_9BACI